jgi:hypothetical protein
MAIIASVFLLLLFGIIEFGRFMAAYTSIHTASREAARFGSAVGDSANGIPQYSDCDEIRTAGKRISTVVAFSDGDFSVTFDNGPGTAESANCNGVDSIPESEVARGDRVVVKVTKTFESGMPLIGGFLDGIVLSSIDRRTVFEDEPS